MVNINELRLSSDRSYIILDASVPDTDYTKNIYISAVTVNNSSQYHENGVNNEEYVFYKDFAEGRNEISTKDLCGCIRIEDNENELGGDIVEPKRIVLNIPITDTDDIYFVYIETSGDYGVGVPCGEDEPVTMAVIYDKEKLYGLGMEYIREVEKSCFISHNFIDYMIKEKLFTLLIETGNYLKAIDLWKKLDKRRTTVHGQTNCNCYEA